MTNQKIDNSLKDYGKTVLWQYDKAYRLLSLLKHLQTMFYVSVQRFWDYWESKVLNIDNCDSFGTKLWGFILGVGRPVVAGDNEYSHEISTTVYRRLLKGAFYLMQAGCDMGSVVGYLEIVFGVIGEAALTPWEISVTEYGWTVDVEDPSTKTISTLGTDGTVTVTTDASMKGDMLFIKLRDPNGIVRKVGGAAIGSLSLGITYFFGETKIEAAAVRRRKCGVTLVDNGDMSISYGKSEYWDEMQEDQRSLFEQHFAEVMPFPLGVGTGEPVEQWVFGFAEQQNDRYAIRAAYDKGNVFGYVDSEGHAFNWECIEDISSEENTSFDAIREKVRKTYKGDPFVSSFSAEEKPYRCYRWGYGGFLRKYLAQQCSSITFEGPLWVVRDGDIMRVAELETPVPSDLSPLYQNQSHSVVFAGNIPGWDYGTWRSLEGVRRECAHRYVLYEYTNIEEFLSQVNEAYDSAIVKRYYTKSQAEEYIPGISYLFYTVLMKEGERRMLTRYQGWIVAPKVCIMSAIAKRIIEKNLNGGNA